MIVHFVVPSGIDDPRRPSGGNAYDRRLGIELERLGWTVREHRVAGREALARVLATLPEGSTVLVDGLVGARAAGTVAAGRWLQVVLLLHMTEANPEVLDVVAGVVTTSESTRRWVLDHGVPPERVRVATPGVDPGPPVAGSAGGGELLCVGKVSTGKGYDVLVPALDLVRDLDWHCRWVGPLDLEPVADDRVTFTGPLAPEDLDLVRSTTDLVVAPSLREAYGMAVAEGLARGIPAVATDVGGHPEAVGDAGLLVPAGDPVALADALRRWLTDPDLRATLRSAAAARADALPSWPQTAAVVGALLADLNRTGPDAVLTSSRHRTDR